MNDLLKSPTIITTIIITLLCSLLFIYMFYQQLSRKDSDVSKMKKNLAATKKDREKIISINDVSKPKKDPYNNNLFDKKINHYSLRDCYVLSSYNSCCGGLFSNDYVSLEALDNVLRHGARFVDFEVYYKDNKPVVSAARNEFQTREYNLYNHLDLKDVLNYCVKAFEPEVAPNHKDPLFINIRIRSQNSKFYCKLVDVIQNSRINDSSYRDYGYQNDSYENNFGDSVLEKLNRKVFIFCDDPNNVIDKLTVTKNNETQAVKSLDLCTIKNNKENKKNLEFFCGNTLFELITLKSNTQYLGKLNNYDVLYGKPSHDPVTTVENNKLHLTISTCSVDKGNGNVDFDKHAEYGIQFICLNFQKLDANFYNAYSKFVNYGSAFMIKAPEKRYKEIVVKIKKQDPKLSFAERHFAVPGGLAMKL